MTSPRSVFDFNYSGIPITLALPGMDDHISGTIVQTSSFYEEDLLRALRGLLSAGDLVVDVGANIGNHSVFFAAVCGCRVVAYEANEEALGYLAQNVRLNRLDKKITVRGVGVSHAKGKLRLRSIKAGNLGSATFECTESEGDVDAVRLDDENFRKPVKLLKIDVEGMEQAVISGALALIEASRPLVVCEARTEDHFRNTKRLLAGSNYVPIASFGATATYLFASVKLESEYSELFKLALTHAAVARAKLQDLTGEHRETRKTVIKHTTQLGEIDGKVRAIDQQLSDSDGKARELASKFDESLGSVNALGDSVGDAKRSLGSLSDHVRVLSERLGSIEGRIAGAEMLDAAATKADSPDVKLALASVTADIGALRGLVDSLTARYEQVSAAMRDRLSEEREARIANQVNTTSLQEQLKSSVGDISRVQGRLERLDSRLRVAIRDAGHRMQQLDALPRQFMEMQGDALGLAQRVERLTSAQSLLEGSSAQIQRELAGAIQEVRKLDVNLLEMRDSFAVEMAEKGRAISGLGETFAGSLERLAADTQARIQVSNRAFSDEIGKERTEILAEMGKAVDAVRLDLDSTSRRLDDALAELHQKTDVTHRHWLQTDADLLQIRESIANEVEERRLETTALRDTLKESLSCLSEDMQARIDASHGEISEVKVTLRSELLGEVSALVDGIHVGLDAANRRFDSAVAGLEQRLDAAYAGKTQVEAKYADLSQAVEKLTSDVGNVRETLSGMFGEQVARVEELLDYSERILREESLEAHESLRKAFEAEAVRSTARDKTLNALRVHVDSLNRAALQQREDHDRQISRLEQNIVALGARHDALLNGRLFGTLSKIKSVFRVQGAAADAPLLLGAPEVNAALEGPIMPAAAPGDLANPVSRIPLAEGIPEEVSITRRMKMEREAGALVAPDVSLPANPKVSVIMTTFNSAQYVASAIDSILQQDYEDLELIIVDDQSTDRTLTRLWQKAKQDSRIRIIESKQNRGTYWSKNLGVIEARGQLVTFMDSDDFSEPARLRKQVEALMATSRGVASTCNYIRKDPAGNIVLNRGLEQRVGLISLMVKREVFEDVGYFDSIRTSADDEFLERIKLVYGRSVVAHVNEPLYVALLRENSLTTEQGNSNNLTATDAGAFLSAARAHFAKSYREWHAQVKASGRTPYVPFPSTCRPFPVYGKLRIEGDRYRDQPVIAFMASFPPRIEKLRESVASLLPQVDRLYVYLNGYQAIPDFLQDERIIVEVGGEDLRDNGKIFHMKNACEGYFFTVDDDICYPYDYTAALVRAVERYGRKAIVGVHGVVLEQPLTRYFSPNRTVYSFKHALDKDVRVNLLGTGTTALHSSLVRPSLTQFPKSGMADVWLAVLAKKAGINMISVARGSGWLAPIVNPGEQEPTLYDEFKENDLAQTEVLASMGDWSI